MLFLYPYLIKRIFIQFTRTLEKMEQLHIKISPYRFPSAERQFRELPWKSTIRKKRKKEGKKTSTKRHVKFFHAFADERGEIFTLRLRVQMFILPSTKSGLYHTYMYFFAKHTSDKIKIETENTRVYFSTYPFSFPFHEKEKGNVESQFRAVRRLSTEIRRSKQQGESFRGIVLLLSPPHRNEFTGFIPNTDGILHPFHEPLTVANDNAEKWTMISRANNGEEN